MNNRFKAVLVLGTRQPSPFVILLIGVLVASWLAVAVGIRLGAEQGDIAKSILKDLALNNLALATIVTVIWAGQRITSVRSLARPAHGRSILYLYSLYGLAGFAGGIVWHTVADAAGFAVLARSTLEQWLQVGVITSFALAAGILFDQFRTLLRRLRSQQAALQAQVEELERSRALIAEREERQREQVASLLHGPIQTRLFVAWRRLAECQRLLAREPRQAQELLEEVRSELDRLREQDVRQGIQLLRPAVIRVSLSSALDALLDDVRKELPVTLEIDERVVQLDNAAKNLIPESVRLVAYRIIEEALENARRHARARSARVRLTANGDALLRILVQDDGQGLDVANTQPGLGLADIAARVTYLSGTWHLASAPGSGTELSVTLPLGPVPRPPGPSAGSAPAQKACTASLTPSPVALQHSER